MGAVWAVAWEASMIDIEWTPELSVGMDEIDQQHQQLYAIIEQLLDARKQNLDHKSILSLLTRLVDYSDYHFRTEDNYMIENEYPLFLSHRKEHLTYIRKMGELIDALENKNASLSHDMLVFLCDWWKRHVSNSDMKFARYINAQKKES
jgi:hemerythrin